MRYIKLQKSTASCFTEDIRKTSFSILIAAQREIHQSKKLNVKTLSRPFIQKGQVNYFFHHIFSTNTFLPFTWFPLMPFTHFTLQFSQRVLSTNDDCAFYPTFFNSRDLHYVFSMTCFTLKPITHFTLKPIMHFTIGFFQHAFSTKAIHHILP